MGIGTLQNNSFKEVLTISPSDTFGVNIQNPLETFHAHKKQGAHSIGVYTDSVLDALYGGFVGGKGVAGEGGYLTFGTVDNSVFSEKMNLTTDGSLLPISTNQNLGSDAKKWKTIFLTTVKLSSLNDFPQDAVAGEICFKSGVHYGYNGTEWKAFY